MVHDAAYRLAAAKLKAKAANKPTITSAGWGTKPIYTSAAGAALAPPVFKATPKVGGLGNFPLTSSAATGTPPAPTGSSAPPTGAQPPSGPKTPDYRDTGFQGAVLALMQQLNGQQTNFGVEAQRDDADYQTNLSRLAEQRANSLQGLNSDFNRSGLFYSSSLGRARKDTEGQYRAQEDDQRTAYNRRADDRRAALQALGEIHADPTAASGFSGSGSAAQQLLTLINEAAGRQNERNQSYVPPEEAAAQDPAAAPAAAPPPVAAPAASVAQPSTRTAFGHPMNFGATPATPKPKPGYAEIQTIGPRAGQSFNYEMKGNRKYKVYASGERVLA